MEKSKKMFTDKNFTSLCLKNDTLNCLQSKNSTDSALAIAFPDIQVKKENLKEIKEHFTDETGTLITLGVHLGNMESKDPQTTPLRILDLSQEVKPILHLDNNNEHIDLTEKAELLGNKYEKSHTLLSDNTVINKKENLENICVDEVGVKISNIPNPSEPENIDELLKFEVDLDDCNAELKSAEHFIKSENSFRTPQLKINLERLSISNQTHKEAMAKLPRAVSEIVKLDLKTMSKISEFGFVKVSSDLLNSLVTKQPKTQSKQTKKRSKQSKKQSKRMQKKVYPKGHYFSRLKNVVYDKDEFDKDFFHKALRRRANVDDQGKFLKYQCPTCPYKSWSFMALSKHHIGLHRFSLNMTFKCSHCDFTARVESAIKRHNQRHKKEPDLACPHCPYITRFDVGLRTHLRRWHLSNEEAKTLNCPECNFVSVCKTTYEAHLMVHMNRDKNYLSRFLHKSSNTNEADILKCEYCKFQTPNKNGLRRHMQETHKIENPFEREIYRCKFCGFETKHKFSYDNHLILHKNKDEVATFYCYNCDFKTRWKKILVVHMRTDHPRDQKEEKQVVFYKCAECDKQYPKKYWLKNHIFAQHRESELLLCHYCNYTTKRMGPLKRHILNIHINPKKKTYPCQKCSHVTEDRDKHKDHLRTHKFICHLCGLEVGTKEAIRYHIVGHMNKKKQRQVVKMHRCKMCEYESRNKHHYLRHMKRWSHYPEQSLESTEKEDI